MQTLGSGDGDGPVRDVVVNGDVDLSTAPALERAITEAVTADGVTRVLVDLSAVEFMDSSGIAVLLKGRRAADERSVEFRVTGGHGIVRQVLELTGVWTYLSGEPGHTQPTLPWA